MCALTLDEEENLYANLVASAARGPLRRASLEVLVLEGNMEARRRLIILLIVATMLCMA